jgi:Sap, sulfolipid-1-addressing protein
LTNATPRKTFAVGVILTLPGVSFVAGMDELSKQHLGVAAKVVLVLLFNVTQLLIIEVPLVGYFVKPDATDAAIKRFHDFLSRDGNRIVLIGGTVIGLLLLARGIIRLA